jgi:HEPN domain-containing protein/predicted nucleotidyltransferase
MAKARTEHAVTPESAMTASKAPANATVSSGRERDVPDADLAALDARLVERIVRKVQPLQIILFGSRAKGTHRPTSDLDLLVIVPNGTDTRKVWDKVCDAVLANTPLVDSLVATQETIERYGDLVGMVYRPALRDGRVLYDSRFEANGDSSAACAWEVQPVTEDLRLEETRRWLRRALQDQQVAEELFRLPNFEGPACYHAEQAAEKALKAVLVFLQIQYPFTHKLDVIRDVIPPGWRVKRIRRDLNWLSAWAIQGRYPDQGPDATRADADRAIALSRIIYVAVVRDLEDRGLSPEA